MNKRRQNVFVIPSILVVPSSFELPSIYSNNALSKMFNKERSFDVSTLYEKKLKRQDAVDEDGEEERGDVEEEEKDVVDSHD